MGHVSDSGYQVRTIGKASRATVLAIAGFTVVGIASLTFRLPSLFLSSHGSFDEGVYGASVFAMRGGDRPFHDVFSSQGPLFLPILRLGDIVGFEAQWAPRLATVGAGIFARGRLLPHHRALRLSVSRRRRRAIGGDQRFGACCRWSTSARGAGACLRALGNTHICWRQRIDDGATSALWCARRRRSRH